MSTGQRPTTLMPNGFTNGSQHLNSSSILLHAWPFLNTHKTISHALQKEIETEKNMYNNKTHTERQKDGDEKDHNNTNGKCVIQKKFGEREREKKIGNLY